MTALELKSTIKYIYFFRIEVYYVNNNEWKNLNWKLPMVLEAASFFYVSHNKYV